MAEKKVPLLHLWKWFWLPVLKFFIESSSIQTTAVNWQEQNKVAKIRSFDQNLQGKELEESDPYIELTLIQ
jgi:hypothetical protein